MLNHTYRFALIALFILILAPKALLAQDKLDKKLKIYILAGQSNMEGKGSVYTMSRQLENPDKKQRFQHLRNEGEWISRDDVWIDYLGGKGRRHGQLTVGYGVSKPGSMDWFGPELGFGWTLGEHTSEPILIIKTAWGGKSLDRDFRPPSRGIPKSATEQFEKRKKKNPKLTLEEYNQGYGHFYRQMIQEVKTVTSDIKTYCPNYENQGYELAGFVWFQGFNDQFGPTSVEDYQDNLVAFIKDVRKELESPNLPFVIGAMGHQGNNQKGKVKLIADAQVAAAEKPEFAGNVVTIRTAQYWDMEAEEGFQTYWADKKNRDIDKWREFGNDRPYHYYGSPVFFYNVGVAFGKAMIEISKVD